MEVEDLYRANLEFLRSCCTGIPGVWVLSVVVSGLFLLTVKYNDNKCKKTLSDIFENCFHLESK